MSTDEVLNQIDSAVHDWTVSADAMRSRPATEPTLGSKASAWVEEHVNFPLTPWQRAVFERLYDADDPERIPLGFGFDGTRDGVGIAVADAAGNLRTVAPEPTGWLSVDSIVDECAQFWRAQPNRFWMNDVIPASPLLWEGDQA